MAINPRLSRLIDLVPFISSHQGIPIKALAEKFATSVAEIEKDLWLLYCCGLPGQTPLELMEFSFEDGFVTVRNADELRAPRSLTQTEVATLIVGLDLLNQENNQVIAGLKSKLANKFSSQISYQPSGKEIFLPEITQSIQNNKVLKIKYLGKVREVIPFEIYDENGATYLRAYCKSAKERRTFKLSRIEELESLDKQELPPNDVPSETKSQVANVNIHREHRRVREMLGVSRDNQSQVSYYSEDWLLGQVISLGGAVELLDTPLRLKLQARIQASQNLYLG